MLILIRYSKDILQLLTHTLVLTQRVKRAFDLLDLHFSEVGIGSVGY